MRLSRAIPLYASFSLQMLSKLTPKAVQAMKAIKNTTARALEEMRRIKNEIDGFQSTTLAILKCVSIYMSMHVSTCASLHLNTSSDSHKRMKCYELNVCLSLGLFLSRVLKDLLDNEEDLFLMNLTRLWEEPQLWELSKTKRAAINDEVEILIEAYVMNMNQFVERKKKRKR